MMDANRKFKDATTDLLLHQRATWAFWIGASVFLPACPSQRLLFVIVAVSLLTTEMGGRSFEWKVDIQRAQRSDQSAGRAHHIINSRVAL